MYMARLKKLKDVGSLRAEVIGGYNSPQVGFGNFTHDILESSNYLSHRATLVTWIENEVLKLPVEVKI